MIVKRKLYSVMDEEEQREFARGTGAAVYYAEQMMKNKGNKIANKSAKRISTIERGRELFDTVRAIHGTNNYVENCKLSGLGLDKIDPIKHSLNDIYLIRGRKSLGGSGEGKYKEFPTAIHSMDSKTPGNIKGNKRVIKFNKKLWQ